MYSDYLYVEAIFCCLEGKRAHSSRPQKRSKNVSVIGAIGLKGLISKYSLVGATDGLTFEAFISQHLVPQLWEGACVVMDVPFKKEKKLRI